MVTHTQVGSNVIEKWHKRIRWWNKGLQIRIKQLNKKNDLSCVKLYTLVHLVYVAYTSGFTGTKFMYTYAHTFGERKAWWDGKLRLNNTKGQCHGINPQY